METVKIGHWYGHYDSRGGAQIIIGAKTEDEALKYHLERNYCVTQDEDEELWSDLWRNIQEDDFVRTVIVRFFNEPKEQDLIYDKEVTGWGLVKVTTVVDSEGWVENGSDDIEEIWIADPGQRPPAPKGYQFCSLDQFGEDAFGVVIQFYKEDDNGNLA